MFLQARFALWSPGGPLARELAKNPTVLIVNDTVFVHGGLTVEHIEYGLEKINLEVAQWMRGDPVGEGGRPAPPPFLAMGDQSSLMWNRTFSKERFSNPRDKYTVCQQLNEALQAIKCERMVVGHTPQFSGCNAECNRKVRRRGVGWIGGVSKSGRGEGRGGGKWSGAGGGHDRVSRAWGCRSDEPSYT